MLKKLNDHFRQQRHGACGKPIRPSLTTSSHHRPVMMTHPSQMHSTTFIHGLKCRMTPLHKNYPHLCWPPPLTIDSSTVERVSSTKFLGVHITENLTWTTNTISLSKKAQQRLHFLRRLKRASLSPPILTTFYRGTIGSVLTSCITVWYGNCGVADRKTLQRTVNTAAKIIGAPLPSILDIFLTRCSSRSNSLVKDPTHPSHSLFQLLPLGRRYRNIRARSARLLNSPPTPPTLPHHRKKLSNFFVQFKVCYTQVSGPVQTTCSNTLSSIGTRHFSHTTVCT